MRRTQLRSRECHIALDVFLGIEDRLQADHVVLPSRSRLQKTLYFRLLIVVRDSGEQFGLHPEHVRALLRRQHYYAAGLRLISKPRPRSQKNEREDQSDDYIVLPTGTRIVPKRNPFRTGEDTGHSLDRKSTRL